MKPILIAFIVLAVMGIASYRIGFTQAQVVVEGDSKGACYYYHRDTPATEYTTGCSVVSKTECEKYGTYGYTDPENSTRVPNSTFIAGKSCPTVPFKIYDELESGNVVTFPPGTTYEKQIFEDRGKTSLGYSLLDRITEEEMLCDPKANKPTQKLRDQCFKKIKEYVQDNSKTSQCQNGFAPVIIAGPYVAAEHGAEWRNERNWYGTSYDHMCWATCRVMVSCVPVPSPTSLSAPAPTSSPLQSSLTPSLTPTYLPLPTGPTPIPTLIISPAPGPTLSPTPTPPPNTSDIPKIMM